MESDTIHITTYLKRKLKYELIDLIGVLSFLSIFVLIIGQKTQNEFIETNSTPFIILFVIGFLWLIIRLFIGKIKWLKPVVESGELEFSDNSLILNGKKIELKEIRKVRIEATSCKGLPIGGRSGISDGTGNYIEIFLKNNLKLKERILIESIHQRDNLKALMERWKNAGIVIIADWKPLLHIFQK
jgi:hypothetical protein